MMELIIFTNGNFHFFQVFFKHELIKKSLGMMIPTDFHRFLEGGTTNQHRLDHLKMEAIGSPKNVRNPEGNHPRRSLQRYTYIYTHTYIYIYIYNELY